MAKTQKPENQTPVNGLADLFGTLSSVEYTDSEPKVDDLDDEAKLETEEQKPEGTKEEESKTETIEEDTSEVTSLETQEFSFVPFIQDLVDADILIEPQADKYADSEDGFRELVQDTVKSKVTQEVEAFKASLTPEGLEILDLLANGGSLSEYISIKELDYTSIDLSDEDNQINLIKEHLELTGYSEEDIDKTITKYRKAELLEDQAATAQKYLIKNQETAAKNLIETQKKEYEAEKLKIQQEVEELKETILNTTELNGIKVPKKEMEKLYSFITTPIDNKGTTKYLSSLTQEDQLTFAWLKMKGFKLDDFEKTVRSETVKTLQEKLSNYKDKRAHMPENPIAQEKNDESKTLVIPDFWGKKKN